jgi:predicted ArsR family transcriptional regulator
MRTTLENNDRQFLKQLHRLATATVQSLCKDQGVTATAVRQRLSRLQGLGFVSREVVRHGRGRPSHTYQLTQAGRKELGDNYSDLAVTLWRELQHIEDSSLRDQAFGRIRDSFVSQYRHVVQGETITDRMHQLQGAMVERGFSVEVDTSGDLPILRETNCPYTELAESDPWICELEVDVMRTLLGPEIRLGRCCRDGDACCEFQLA